VLRQVTVAAFAVVALSQSGCVVFKRDYDQVVQNAAQMKTASDAKQADDAARIADLQKQLTIITAAVQDRDARLSDMSAAVHNMQAQLDEATAINQELRSALERMGKDADKLLAERGTLSKALDDAKARLEELRRAQAAAEARVAVFKDFETRFAALIQAGQLRIETRRGHMVMALTGDLLFEPNRAELRSAGKGALMEVAKAMQSTAASAPGRRFLVTAHVDDEPLKSKHYHSTWELTAERGAVVVDYLVSLGLAPASFEAAGAGSFDPLVPDDSPDDRARNRRVEIALLPAPEPAAAPTAAPSGSSAPVASPPAPPAASSKPK
jgi:chemotaxis protein MotB